MNFPKGTTVYVFCHYGNTIYYEWRKGFVVAYNLVSLYTPVHAHNYESRERESFDNTVYINEGHEIVIERKATKIERMLINKMLEKEKEYNYYLRALLNLDNYEQFISDISDLLLERSNEHV